MDPVDAWLPVAALAFAAMPGIRTDDWLVTADLLLAGTLTAGTIACSCRRADHPRPGARDPDDGDGPRRRGDHGCHPDARVPHAPPDRLRTGTPARRGHASPPAPGARPRSCAGSSSRCRSSPCSRSCSRPPTPCSRSSPARPSAGASTSISRPSSIARCGWASWPGAWPGCWPSPPARSRPRPGWIGRGRRRWHARSAHPAGRRPAAPAMVDGRLAGRGERGRRCGSRCGSARSRRRRSCGWSSRCSPPSSCSSSPTCSAAATRCRSPASRTRTTRGAGSSSWLPSRCSPGTLVVALDLAVARRGRAQLAASLALLALTGVVLRVRVRAAPALPGRLWLDRAPVRGRRRDPVARGRARHRRVAGARPDDALDAPRAGHPRARHDRCHERGRAAGVRHGPQPGARRQPGDRPRRWPDGSRRGLSRDARRRGGARHRGRLPAAAHRGPPVGRTRSSRGVALALRADPSVQGWPAWNLTRARARAALEGWTPSS